ncbi:MAG: hypothetical protein HC805_03360 [Alkalinema sp. RL_2_19]|nr:hypothetical protein [Alkalinema sp. RL_2_19]
MGKDKTLAPETLVPPRPPVHTSTHTSSLDRPSLDRWGVLLVVLSAAGFGTLGIFGKLAYAENFTVLNSLVWRLGGGATVLWLWLLGQRRWRIQRRSAIAAFSLGAIIYALQALLFLAH